MEGEDEIQKLLSVMEAKEENTPTVETQSILLKLLKVYVILIITQAIITIIIIIQSKEAEIRRLREDQWRLQQEKEGVMQISFLTNLKSKTT